MSFFKTSPIFLLFPGFYQKSKNKKCSLKIKQKPYPFLKYYKPPELKLRIKL